MSIVSENLVFNITQDEYIDLNTYQSRGGYAGLRKALGQAVEVSVAEVSASGLRGRGGAAFPTGRKLEMMRLNTEAERYIVCNADEGEPGTFKDRYIMTHLPFQLLEGITISAYLAGASRGFIYVRHEYPEAQATLRRSIREAEQLGFLGKNILGSHYSLELEIFSGAGSYLCGEETALLSSIEGRKGRPRIKPPYPAQAGLWGKPTLINNVETLSNIPKILERGALWYKGIGDPNSTGTKLISLSGDVRRRGLIEVPFGVTFAEVIEKYGGGAKPSRKIKAVNIGGASGVLVPPQMLQTPLDYGACQKVGITIGSGAVFVLDDTRSIIDNVHNRVRFFLHESCGKCTPCREGLRQVNVILNRMQQGRGTDADMKLLQRYTNAIQNAAFCGLGQAAGNSLASSLLYYWNEYLNCCEATSVEVQA